MTSPLPTRALACVTTVAAAAAIAICLAAFGAHPARATTARAESTSSLVRPERIHLAGAETLHQAAPIIGAADWLYTFWDTGNARYLDHADVPDFHDNTLPAGRKQGRIGILDASKVFRAAVPDLHCRVVNLYVTGSTFTAQLVFSGRFTGTLDGRKGAGQRIRFNAIDIQHVGSGGRITEDWHIEDNLTFLEQTGVVTAP